MSEEKIVSEMLNLGIQKIEIDGVEEDGRCRASVTKDEKDYLVWSESDYEFNKNLELVMKKLNNKITHKELAKAIGVDSAQPTTASYSFCTQVLSDAVVRGKIKIIKNI